MSFTPKHTLSQLAKIAGFNDVDELAKYAHTSRQNLNNWNNKKDKQNFLRVVISGAQNMKAHEIKIQARQQSQQSKDQ